MGSYMNTNIYNGTNLIGGELFIALQQGPMIPLYLVANLVYSLFLFIFIFIFIFIFLFIFLCIFIFISLYLPFVLFVLLAFFAFFAFSLSSLSLRSNSLFFLFIIQDIGFYYISIANYQTQYVTPSTFDVPSYCSSPSTEHLDTKLHGVSRLLNSLYA